jgi:hypothetical protein
MIANIFRLLNVGLTQQRLVLFFSLFLCEEYKTSRSHADVLIFIFLEAPDHVFTSLQLPTIFWTG